MHAFDPDLLILLQPASGPFANEGVPAATSAQTAAQQAREQAQAARDQAQSARDQAQQIRDQVRASIAGTEEAVNAQDGSGRTVRIQTGPNGVTITREGGIPVPPAPPGAPGTSYSSTYPVGLPPGVKDISIAFFICMAFMVVGWPIARAFGRRIERRSDQPSIAPGMSDQLQRIEQAVDAMSIEIERISESQRFMAKLQNANAERAALPAERA